MAGLLDFLQTPAGTGLLSGVASYAMNARRGTPVNNLGRGLAGGLTGYAQSQEDILRKQQLDEAQKMRDLQMEQTRMQMDQLKGQQAWRAGLPAVREQSQPKVEQFQPDTFDQADNPFGQMANVTPGNPQVLQDYLMKAESPFADNILEKQLFPKAPKFSTSPQYDQQGRAFILAEDGSMKYLDGVKARDKLNEVRLGDKVGFRTDYSPDLQGSLPIGQSPDSVMSNQVTMRGQNMTDKRARDLNAITQQGNGIKLDEKTEAMKLAKAGQVASFDVMLGSLDRLGKHPGLARSVGVVGAFPTMPGSESANFKAELDTFQSQAFLPMVSQLKGMGALSDAEGKKLTAAVGALNPNMGETAFRESIARITSDMMAARKRLTGENRSSGASGEFDAPKPKPKFGEVRGDYYYKSGDPADPKSWVKK